MNYDCQTGNPHKNPARHHRALVNSIVTITLCHPLARL
jgi:hypothetical protein